MSQTDLSPENNQLTPRQIFWYAFGIWMAVTGLLILLYIFGPSFMLRIKARDILYTGSLPWSFMIALPLWFNLGLFLLMQILVSAINGLIFASLMRMLGAFGLLKSRSTIKCAATGLGLALLQALLASLFGNQNSAYAASETGAIRLLIINLPASLFWLYDYSSKLFFGNFIFYFAVGYAISWMRDKKRMRNI